jgi:uncharacterized protein YecE (DUF72 family)
MIFLQTIYTGTAGWTIPAQHRESFSASGSHLERYAQVLSAVEVNSSFYRPHQYKTWARWAASTPEEFRFSVKIPKSITHEARLTNCDEQVIRFKSEASGLGEKLGVLLVQLPPSLKFDLSVAERFFDLLALSLDAPIVIEPRHASWFSDAANKLVEQHQICRASVDPSPIDAPLVGIHSNTLAYFRLHGSPTIYYSNYSSDALDLIANEIMDASRHSQHVWCIFDNTAEGHATSNAIEIAQRVSVHSSNRDD